MNRRASITRARLHELFHYDARTGVFTRRQRSGPAKAGTVAGWRSGAYWKIVVDGIQCYRHQLVWVCERGEWPTHEIDHKDTCEFPDAITNLRAASSQQNKRNRGVNANSKLGIKGVHLCHQTGRYRARIGLNYRTVDLGRFDTAEQARQARVSAELTLFGEFAKTNYQSRNV
jgi:hypothetical protein